MLSLLSYFILTLGPQSKLRMFVEGKEKIFLLTCLVLYLSFKLKTSIDDVNVVLNVYLLQLTLLSVIILNCLIVHTNFYAYNVFSYLELIKLFNKTYSIFEFSYLYMYLIYTLIQTVMDNCSLP